jgi:recombination protein RecA
MGKLKSPTNSEKAARGNTATADKPSGRDAGSKSNANGKAVTSADRVRSGSDGGTGLREQSAEAREERDPAKGAALKAALTQIERQFGQGSLMRLGDDAAAVSVSAIPTGALSLDLALGVGGVPRGRIVEIFGPESSGKTTLVYEIIAQAQKMGGVCAFIDAEHAIDPTYARRIGVDIDELLVSQPDHGEQALEIADVLIRSGAIDIVAIDSVAALTPRVELEGQMGDQQVGLQARLMSQALRKLAGNLNRANTVCVFTNQIREKVGVFFGSPETQPGGRALKFYASQRIDIRRIETLKEGTEAVGNRVRTKIVKNKVAPPFREAEFDIEYGLGISAEGCLLDLGLEHGLVQKSGSFFSYDGERLGQGRNNAKAFLREHPQLMEELEGKIYEALGLKSSAAPAGSALDDLLPGDQDESGTTAQDLASQEQAA